jgi:hypothetical protein
MKYQEFEDKALAVLKQIGAGIVVAFLGLLLLAGVVLILGLFLAVCLFLPLFFI